MAAGECWYVNVNEPHRVANAGSTPRIHLVVDRVVDEWVDKAFGLA
jgi:quercetin dioxygenase-like cupin family protein